MSPELKRIRGMKFSLYNRNEHPSPHVHVQYAEYTACISIKGQRLLRGSLPGKQESFARDWIAAHKTELLQMWADKMKPGGIYYIKD